MTQDSDATGREGRGVEPPLRGGAFRLPGLRRWRLRRGLTQVELAETTGLDQRHLTKIETGKRGCQPSAAQRLAEELGVGVAELRAHSQEQETRPAKRRVYRRDLQLAYLKVLLGRVAGSTYSTMDEKGLEAHCRGLSWEEMLGVVSCRRREVEVVRETLADADLPEDARLFLEEVLGAYPDRVLRLLAAAREREVTTEGREGLTRAMRELL